YRDNAFRQPIKIDLNCDWSTWSTRTLGCGVCSPRSCTCSGATTFASPPRCIAYARTRNGTATACADASVFIALGKQRTGIRFLQYGQIQTKILFAVV